LVLRNNDPVISFTFDDFPRSALHTGGAILTSFGLKGTYYAALGLMGRQEPTGTMFLAEDLTLLQEQGHELGCHTFSHCHSAETETREFEKAITANQQALNNFFPTASFTTFSYPISPPRARTKRKVSRRFVCCRGGGQTFNAGTADLGYLAAYFLEQSRGDIEVVKDVIQRNHRARGWLIFATHDICDAPTPFGCTPEFFEGVVRCSLASGARILPVAQAWREVGGSPRFQGAPALQ
jgi:peptidoglycan/xylan/chitin deacetylase (PgdA/CDA1 family)